MVKGRKEVKKGKGSTKSVEVHNGHRGGQRSAGKKIVLKVGRKLKAPLPQAPADLTEDDVEKDVKSFYDFTGYANEEEKE